MNNMQCRTHECWTCGIGWETPISKSDTTQDLSGDITGRRGGDLGIYWCPQCGRQASMSSRIKERYPRHGVVNLAPPEDNPER